MNKRWDMAVFAAITALGECSIEEIRVYIQLAGARRRLPPKSVVAPSLLRLVKRERIVYENLEGAGAIYRLKIF